MTPAITPLTSKFSAISNTKKKLDDKTTLVLSSFFQNYEYHAEDAYDFGERIVTRGMKPAAVGGAETRN